MRAGDKHNKPPIPPGIYEAFERSYLDPYKFHKVELRNVSGYKNIQIHTGNTADDVKGCFAVGNSRSIDFVG